MIYTIGRVLASLSGLLVTGFGVWAAYDFVSKVKKVMDMQPTLTFMDIMKQGAAFELILVVTLIIVGLNIFLPNCLLVRMACGTSCAEKKDDTIEVIKA